MERLDYLRALQRRWVIVLAATLVTGAAAWLTAPASASPSSSPFRIRGTAYEATHTLIIDRESASRRSDKYSQTANLPLLAVLATSGEVPLRVIERLGLKTTPPAIAGKVEVEAETKLDLLRVTSTGSSPGEVAALVDAFAEEVLRLAAERNEALRKEALNRATVIADAQRARIRELDSRLAQLPTDASESRLLTAERGALLKVYAEQQSMLQDLQSQPPASPGLVSLGPAVPVPTGSGDVSGAKALQITADRRVRVGVGALLGFVLGSALAVLVDRVDTRIRTRREAERAFGLPVVAEIPRTRPLSARAVGGHGGALGVAPETADAYGRLGLAVLHSPCWVLSPRPPFIGGDDEEDGAGPMQLVEGPTRLVLVTSPGREESRAAVIANLAVSLAASGRRVIAIDCDPERSRLAELLGVRVTEDVETATEEVARRLQPRPSAVRGVSVVAPGPCGGADLAVDGQLVRSYLEWGDVVLVDSGPILSAGEAGSWAVEADAVLVVTAVGRTTAETAELTHDHLARLQARVLGVTLVGGVGRTTRGRPHGAPALPPASPPMSSARSLPPEANGDATRQRLRNSKRTGRQRQSSRPHPGEPIAPALEVLTPPQPSASAPSPPPQPSESAPSPPPCRPHSERRDEPLWSASRPWPWAVGDLREDAQSGSTTSSMGSREKVNEG